ncbi:MAG TPA: MFS transporter [Ilumatobacteraceae bacterium]|jgi:predicted MFS family arabinose efflux permease
MITPDGRRLIATRGLRGYADGLVAASLAGYLGDQLGYSGTRIGVIITGMLLGSAVLTMFTGTWGWRFERRLLLRAGALLMIATGIVFATSTTFFVLLAFGVIGTMNPSGSDVSVVQPIEQSLLPLTTNDASRSHVFARYTFFGGSLAALGALSAGLPARLHWRPESVFVVYALAGVAMLGVYATMSPQVEAAAQVTTPTPLGPSKRIVYRLAALFSLDSFGGGFAVQSLIVLWLLRRHHFSVGKAGVVLGVMQILSAASGFIAVKIERRIGPLRTMAFTHLPGQILLISAALMPNAPLAVACLIARSLLSSMDVPVRNAYVMSVVTPAERAAAASVTNVPRSLASALPPIAAGWMLDRSNFGWPLIIGGSLKIVYDLLLLRMARETGRPSDADRSIPNGGAAVVPPGDRLHHGEDDGNTADRR